MQARSGVCVKADCLPESVWIIGKHIFHKTKIQMKCFILRERSNSVSLAGFFCGRDREIR
ncbi:hypothetical protein EHJ10_10985 [Cronobacter dublinensis]|nr:hypothetical protein [Cronobacter dublinensis]NCH70011.1 hypothetical protein [Cronobacter dublinensis]